MTSVTPLEVVLARFAATVVSELRKLHFRVAADIEHDVCKVILAWQRVEERTIAAAPRQVYWSKELRARDLPEHNASAVRAIQVESEQGADLNPRLTRSYFTTGFNDRIFSVLGIQHFHLGTLDKGKRRGLVSTTSELLFAHLSADALYFLDVLDHGAFKHADLTSILFSNWPELVPKGQGIPGRRDPQSTPTPEDCFQLRSAGVNPVIEWSGKGFTLPGKTIAADGTSGMAVSRTHRIISRIRRGHEWLSANADGLAEDIETNTGIKASSFEVTVRISDETITFEDSTHGITFMPEQGQYLAPSVD